MSGSPGVVIIDNGAWEIKAGPLVGEGGRPTRRVPNCAVKGGRGPQRGQTRVGRQTLDAREAGTVYRRPCERGCVVDWGLQERVWLSEGALGDLLQPSGLHLVLTHALGQPRPLAASMAEVAIETHECASVLGVAGVMAVA